MDPGTLLIDCFLLPKRKEGGIRSGVNFGGNLPIYCFTVYDIKINYYRSSLLISPTGILFKLPVSPYRIDAMLIQILQCRVYHQHPYLRDPKPVPKLAEEDRFPIKYFLLEHP